MVTSSTPRELNQCLNCGNRSFISFEQSSDEPEGLQLTYLIDGDHFETERHCYFPVSIPEYSDCCEYLCQTCCHTHMVCNVCRTVCQLVGHCGYFYRDGIWSCYLRDSSGIRLNRHCENDDYCNICENSYDKCPYYVFDRYPYRVEDLNIYSLDIHQEDSQLGKLLLVGPDGGATHAWKCNICDQVYEMTDK